MQHGQGAEHRGTSKVAETSVLSLPAGPLASRNSPQGITVANRASGQRSQREATDCIGDFRFIYCAHWAALPGAVL